MVCRLIHSAIDCGIGVWVPGDTFPRIFPTELSIELLTSLRHQRTIPSLTRSTPSENLLSRSRLIPYDAPRVQMALPPQKSASAPSKDSTANLGFEAKLWLAADKLRSNMDAGEYKHVVLGLIFLKYISDAFEEHHATLLAGKGDYAGADPEDPDEYKALNVFWVPPGARWTYLQNSAKQPEIGKIVDDAMVAIERDNPRLKGVLPKEYARPALDKHRLGELIDLIGTIGMGDKASRSKDILGRVYEYFLGMFASAEGKKGGQFYTPQSVVRLLVEMLAPYKGRIYDPCCGSGGMFVQSEKFVEAHGGKLGDIAIYGQESNPTTRRLAVMNLALRGIEADFGPEHADTFRRDLHPDLRADYVLANPPFNDSDWFRKDDDVRWQYGVPPRGNANFAWVQHFIHHLAPHGMAGFVLANGSMSSNQSGEGDIRRALIEANLVDCTVLLFRQRFFRTKTGFCASNGKPRDHQISRRVRPRLRASPPTTRRVVRARGNKRLFRRQETLHRKGIILKLSPTSCECEAVGANCRRRRNPSYDA